MKKNGEKATPVLGTAAKTVGGLRSVLEDFRFTICAVLLILYFCAFYWICRLFGIHLEDDF